MGPLVTHLVVTGAEGFLGRRVVQRLASEGSPVIAVDRIYPRGDGPLPGVTPHHADLADPQYLLPADMDHDAPFALVHLAWDMRRYEGYAIQAEQVRQFAALLDYWQPRGLRQVVMMGSAEEYGHQCGLLAETTPPEFPLSPYGWAKRAARDLAKTWAEKREIPFAWLRPFIMYGPGQKGDMLIPSALDAARQGRTAEFTDGRQQRDFVFIEDVVDAIALSLGKCLSGFQEFNLGSGEGRAVADVLLALARHYHAESRFLLGARSRRPNEPDVQIADITCATRQLGWQPRTSWADGLAKLLAG